MFNPFRMILCCCLLKTCNVVFGVTIKPCINGTFTLENPTLVTFECSGMATDMLFWAVNSTKVLTCESTCTTWKPGYTGHTKLNILNTFVLQIKDNFKDLIIGNLTCGDVGENDTLLNVDACIVKLNVDGGWTSWSDNGSCSVTCGMGSKTRTRTCSNPAPVGDGKCNGSGSETTSCNTQDCPTTTTTTPTTITTATTTTTGNHLRDFLEGGADAILAERDPIKRRKKALLVRTAALSMTDQFLAKLASDQSDQSSQSHKSYTKQNLRRVWSALEDVGPIIASSLDAREVKTENHTNLESVFTKTDSTVAYTAYQFSDSSNFELSPMNSFNTFPNTNNDTSVGLCAFYIKNIENLVYDLISTNHPGRAGGSGADDVMQAVVNTQVMMIAVRVGDVSRQNLRLSNSISLTLKMKSTQGLTKPTCVSFQAESLSPTSSGCYSQQINSTHVRCLCSHLTSFTVLMNVVEVDDTDTVLFILSSICLTLSCFCLLLATLTFFGFPNLRWSRCFTLANLSLSLGLAQLLFLLGIHQTSNRVVCAVIAGLLHFLFLAAFYWMGADGLQLYLNLVMVFDSTRNMIPIYVLIGYGVPTVIVAVSAGLRYDGYGMKTRCWLSHEGWLHMAFIGPVVVIIIWNTIIFFRSMMIMRRHLRRSDDLVNVKKQLKGAVGLLAVLGTAWLFGLIQFDGITSAVFSYVFVLLNGTQGVFIFLFQCVFNKQVRIEYYNALYKSRVFPECFKEPVLNLLSRDLDRTITNIRSNTPIDTTKITTTMAMKVAHPEDLMTPVDKRISSVSKDVDVKSPEMKAVLSEDVMTPVDKRISPVSKDVDVQDNARDEGGPP